MTSSLDNLPERCSAQFADFIDTVASCIFSSAILLDKKRSITDELQEQLRIPMNGLATLGKYIRYVKEAESPIPRPNSNGEHIGYKVTRALSYSDTANKIFFCRMMDSMEYYLIFVATELVFHDPAIMLPKQKNSPEYVMKISDFFSHYESEHGLMRSLALSYVKNKDKKKAYEEMIKIYNNCRLKKEVVSKDEIEIIGKLFKLRNSIIHENGRVDENTVASVKSDLDIEDFVGLFEVLGLYALSDFIIKITVRMERLFSKEMGYVCTVQGREVSLDLTTALHMSLPLISAALKPAPQSP